MRVQIYNSTWYSIGVASSLLAIGLPFAGITKASTTSTPNNASIFILLTASWAIYFCTSFALYTIASLSVRLLTKKEITKRIHFYPLILGLTYAPALLTIIVSLPINFDAYILMLIVVHPLLANYALEQY